MKAPPKPRLRAPGLEKLNWTAALTSALLWARTGTAANRIGRATQSIRENLGWFIGASSYSLVCDGPGKSLPELLPVYQKREFTEDGASYAGTSSGGSGRAAGPRITSPVGEKQEPWQGQSQTLSSMFHSISHPTCVQMLLNAWSVPSSSR